MTITALCRCLDDADFDYIAYDEATGDHLLACRRCGETLTGREFDSMGAEIAAEVARREADELEAEGDAS